MTNIHRPCASEHVLLATLLVVFVSFCTLDVHAQQPQLEAPDKPDQQPITQSITRGKRRPVPDYDGRGPEPIAVGDVLIWVPRSALFPVYLVSEYVLRAPLGALISILDENDVPGFLEDFFTFGKGGRSGLVPSALIDFGFRPSVGLYFFSDDTLWKGSGVRSHLAYGGTDWYRATATLRHTINEETATRSRKTAQAKFSFSHRPDWLFYGVGGETLDEDESAFMAQMTQGELAYDGGFWRSSRVRVALGIQDVLFQDEGCCDEPKISELAALGRYELPAHFNDGYTVGRIGFELAVDTRARRDTHIGDASDFVSPPGTGLKLATRGQLVSGFRESHLRFPAAADTAERPLYVKYGGTLGGYVDLSDQRVVGLQVIADFADPIHSDHSIPFFDLVSLGGARPMRGFLQRRHLGRSSFVSKLEYRWPVWVTLDGTMHYSVGNVFDKHLEEIEASRLRQSFGAGFRATGSRDHTFELLIAAGTQTFEQGSSVDSIRFVFGTASGF